MASTTALFTGLTGLNVHSRRLDVIGNNIANTNTTAFKSSRMLFESQFARTFNLGSSPSATSGGTNPSQIGLGVGIAGVQRDFTAGAFTPTGDARDLAIDGSGFFVVQRDGQRFYTRAGAFRQDLSDNLVTLSGERLQGYGVDDEFNIVEGTLVDINIPIGNRTIAEQTRNASVAGNLNADGDLPGGGSRLTLGFDATSGFGLIPTASTPPTPPNVLEASSLLAEIQDASSADPNATVFTPGQTIEINGASKGDKLLPEAQFEVGSSTTVQEFMDFLTEALGLHTTGSPNPDGATPGVELDPTTGVITIHGNTGTTSDLDIEGGDIRLLDENGEQVDLPFFAQDEQEATGEAVRTTLIVYDSLGTELSVDVTLALESKDASGTTWRYYLDSGEDSDIDIRLGTGTIQFDNFGQLADDAPITVSVDRDASGALSPMSFNLRFDSDNGRTTALDAASQIANVFRDGLPPGTLESFGVQSDGVIFGGFSNGATRVLGQVVIADFSNVEGLVDAGNNNFSVGPNSGPEVVTVPGRLGSGQIASGQLELSNVDLGREFTDLILVQTGYSASARIIRTTDELLQQLLVLGR